MKWSYQAMKRLYHAMKRPYRGLKRPYRGLKRNDYLVREVIGILIFVRYSLLRLLRGTP